MSDPTTDLPRRPVPGPTAPAADHGRTDDAEALTGDATVDAALAELDAVDPALEPGQQLPVLAAVHEALQQRLSSTEV